MKSVVWFVVFGLVAAVWAMSRMAKRVDEALILPGAVPSESYQTEADQWLGEPIREMEQQGWELQRQVEEATRQAINEAERAANLAGSQGHNPYAPVPPPTMDFSAPPPPPPF